MRIDIEQKPPTNIPRLRWNYTRGSLFFLFLVICAIIIGVIGIFFATGYDDVLHNTAFALFVVSGFAFVYFTEKLLGFRKLTPNQEEELVKLAQQYEMVSEYWRQVAEQGRYIVMDEFEAIKAYVQKLESGKAE
ncbi:MAG: hypothetical protein ACWGOD_02860 [Desulfobulbales bacterium]